MNVNLLKMECRKLKEDLLSFEQSFIKLKSFTGDEKEASHLIFNKMSALGYDDVSMDPYGSVLGRIGNGNTKILFDAHIDVVKADNPEEWTHGPFSGTIENGTIWGRGSVDTKSSVVAMVYAGYLIKKLNLLEGKTIYISTSVMEEDIDGEMLDRVISGYEISPDYAVIGEPSNLKLALGHRGRAMYIITTHGVSAHGSMPDKGINAITNMADIVCRVDQLQKQLSNQPGEKGSIAVTKIESHSASLNAIPDQCKIYIDRRLALGETEENVGIEMNHLIKGIDADWKIYDAEGTSWTGEKVILHTFLPAWEISAEHHLVQAGITIYKELLGEEPELMKWDFSTNGFATAGHYKIPTIGLGPGDYSYAHMKDEHCGVNDILNACMFYAGIVGKL